MTRAGLSYRESTKRFLVSSLLTGLAGIAGVAGAATFAVDSYVDDGDASPGDGVCATASSECTLRAAVQEANALAGADMITVPAGVYNLALAGGGEDSAMTGDLDLIDNVTIQGAGRNLTFVDGTPPEGSSADRVFDVGPAGSVAVAILDLTVQRGLTSGHGGGIRNQGELTLTDVRLRWNRTSGGGLGGGLYVATTPAVETTTLTRCDIEGNISNQSGGGVFLDSGTAVITDSNIAFNLARSAGGGVMALQTEPSDGISATITRTAVNSNRTTNTQAHGGGLYAAGNLATVTIANSTISDNDAHNGGGGGVYNSGAIINFENVTIAGNTSAFEGGGLGVGGSSYGQMRNTILADNSDASGVAPDCKRVLSLGYNLIEDTTGCTVAGSTTGNITGSDPNLAPLAYYGWGTRTQPPLPGSVAVDMGDGANCEADDQRGTARPIGSTCDIGAVEADGSEQVPTPPPGSDFIVDSFRDYEGFSGPGNDVTPGDGVCETSFGNCTLRGAIQESNALAGPQVVFLPRGHYLYGQTVSGDNAAAYGDLDVPNGSVVTIRGESAPGELPVAVAEDAEETVITGGWVIATSASDRVFHVLSGGELHLESVTVRNGQAAGTPHGSGVYNQGTTTVIDSIIRDNGGSAGAGIWSEGPALTVTDSVIRNNRAATDDGGGVAVGGSGTAAFTGTVIVDNDAVGLTNGGGISNRSSGDVTVHDSTIAGNDAQFGGGIFHAGGLLEVHRSTISGNRAFYPSLYGYGGGIEQDGLELLLVNSTLSGNEALSGGGGLRVANGTTSVVNSTIVANTSPANSGVESYLPIDMVNSIVASNSSGSQCGGEPSVFTSSGHNISSDASCGFTAAGDHENTDPELGPLTENGGPTLTHEPVAGSPAIDGGDDAAAPATDQRGEARPQGSAADIGSVEVLPANTPPTVTAGSDQTVDEGDLVNLDPATFTDPDLADTHTATIDWDDGSVEPGIVDQVAHTIAGSHVFGDDGDYHVVVTVTDSQAAADDDTFTVTVDNVAPTVDAGPDQAADPGEQVDFSGGFTDPGGDDTHTVEWDFGDGGSASGALTPAHTYAAEGFYTVTLTVTDDDGGVGHDTLEVAVGSPPLFEDGFETGDTTPWSATVP